MPGCEGVWGGGGGYQCVNVCVLFPHCAVSICSSVCLCVCVRAHVCVITLVYATMDMNSSPGFVHM